MIDRFHIQKLACDAVQEIRIGHRWEAIQEETDARQEAKGLKKKYVSPTFENGDTRKELLARSRYLLFKSAENGLNHRNAELQYYSENIRILNGHIPLVIP